MPPMKRHTTSDKMDTTCNVEACEHMKAGTRDALAKRGAAPWRVPLSGGCSEQRISRRQSQQLPA